jgi:hypothetical protein
VKSGEGLWTQCHRLFVECRAIGIVRTDKNYDILKVGSSFVKSMHHVTEQTICSLAVTEIVCIKVYSPTDAQLNCLKNNFKIYIKIDIKTALTCFGAITIIRKRIIRSC